MVIKTYLSKNNTLLYNSTLNTSRNPVAELYFGGEISSLKYSRYIFQFDTDRLKALYTGGTFPDITKLTHTLRMTNTGTFDTDLLGQTACGDKQRTTSFDLILFKINQSWDEGVGYDYASCSYVGGVESVDNSPSNWSEPRRGFLWSGGSGVYSGSSSAITVTTQHFDRGNENIEMDITNEVNSILTGGSTNYGYGIAFTRTLEQTPTDALQYVGFYSKYTQTFYEPFVESIYDNHIKDDRSNFYLDKNNKLYLYVNLGGKPTNLDALPTVTVNDDCDAIYSAYTQSGVTHVTKGVYSIDLNVSTTSAITKDLMFTDTWSNITINGITRPDIQLQFPLVSSNDYYNIGDNDELPKEYGFNLIGVNRDEKIVSGDIRKISISARVPYTVNQKELIDELQYRLYVKEGKAEYTVIDYEDVERTNNNNYFLLDTASLLPNIYYIDIKITSNDDVRNIKDVTRFEIVSLSELRNRQ